MKSSVRSRMTIGLLPFILVVAGLAACGAQGDKALQQLRMAAAGDAGAPTQDPCTLLTATEAERYVGPLASPPYRASDEAADVNGDQCMYRGADGQEVTVRPDWSGGGTSAVEAVQGVTDKLGAALAQSGVAGMDTMAHRVVKTEVTGPWDRATWIPGGSLLASQGERSAQVDVSGASGKEGDAVALAAIIMPRFDHPLRYDGAKAVALVPKPHPHPASACELVPTAAVEAAIGPLNGVPTSDAPETSCTWRVTTADGERAYAVEFVWEGGRKNYQMLIHGMATVGGVMGLPATSPLDTMKPPPEMQQAIGGLMKMIGGGAGNGGRTAAPGAAATIGFRTDTALAGPWNNAALLHGTQLIAVRRDVFVGMDLQSADYDKAKALLAAICSRL